MMNGPHTWVIDCFNVGTFFQSNDIEPTNENQPPLNVKGFRITYRSELRPLIRITVLQSICMRNVTFDNRHCQNFMR